MIQGSNHHPTVSDADALSNRQLETEVHAEIFTISQTTL